MLTLRFAFKPDIQCSRLCMDASVMDPLAPNKRMYMAEPFVSASLSMSMSMVVQNSCEVNREQACICSNVL